MSWGPLKFHAIFDVQRSFLRDMEGNKIENHSVRIFSEKCKFGNRSIEEVLDNLIKMNRLERDKLVEMFPGIPSLNGGAGREMANASNSELIKLSAPKILPDEVSRILFDDSLTVGEKNLMELIEESRPGSIIENWIMPPTEEGTERIVLWRGASTEEDPAKKTSFLLELSEAAKKLGFQFVTDENDPIWLRFSNSASSEWSESGSLLVCKQPEGDGDLLWPKKRILGGIAESGKQMEREFLLRWTDHLNSLEQLDWVGCNFRMFGARGLVEPDRNQLAWLNLKITRPQYRRRYVDIVDGKVLIMGELVS